MHNNKKNEELQSRRESFKKAAKGALPILGAIVLSNNPLVSKAAQTMGCDYTCAVSCADCKGTCKGLCMNSCYKGAK